jgi:hypothetical protein
VRLCDYRAFYEQLPHDAPAPGREGNAGSNAARPALSPSRQGNANRCRRRADRAAAVADALPRAEPRASGTVNGYAKPSKIDTSARLNPRAAHEKIAADLAFELGKCGGKAGTARR